MSIQSEINRIEQNVANTYAALEEQGATMPAEQNSDNLAATARTVPAGSGGVSSWNDLTDKPVVMEGGDTLTWDGNTEGREVAFGTFYKVSDAIPTAEDFVNGGSLVVSVGESFGFTSGDLLDDSGLLLGPEDTFVVVTAEGAEVVGASSGIYFFAIDSGYVTSLTIPGYTGFGQEKIAPSHLYQPDWNQTDETAADFIRNKPFGDELVEIMPETEVVGTDEDGVYVCYLDVSLFSGAEERLSITYDGTEYILDAVDSGLGFLFFGNAKYLGGNDTGEPFCFALAVSLGMAMIALPDAEPHMVGIAKNAAEKIDERFYDRQTTFYFAPGSPYVYTRIDLSLSASSRATRADVLSAVKKGPISVELMTNNSAVALYFTCVGVETDAFDLGYAVVKVCDSYFTNFYTAEYTPET